MTKTIYFPLTLDLNKHFIVIVNVNLFGFLKIFSYLTIAYEDNAFRNKL